MYKDYKSSYEELLTMDESVSLQLHRQRLIALEVYKIISKNCPEYLHDLITPVKDTGHNLRSKNVEAPDFKNVTYGKKSFSYYGSNLWNNMPECMQTAESFKEFKKLVNTWNGKKCKCSLCKFT